MTMLRKPFQIILTIGILRFLSPIAVFGSDLHDSRMRADYLIIAPAPYVTAAETLAAYRARQNEFVSLVVPYDTVLAQFGAGVPADSALKKFLLYALTKWSVPRPRFVVLAGNINAICSHVETVNLGGSVDSALIDQWFVETSAAPGDPVKPLVPLGRLPAWDESSLLAMIRKTIQFESGSGGRWRNRVLSLADGSISDGSLFESDASTLSKILASRWQDTVTVHIRPESPQYQDPACFRSAWNRGAAIVVYNGHGSPTEFSNSHYFTTWNVDSLANVDAPSVCFFGACNQRFEPKEPLSIPVHLLEQPQGGAVAVVAPGGLSFENRNVVFFNALFRRIVAHPLEPLGVSYNKAMQSVLFGAAVDSVTHRMNFMGDPALSLHPAAVEAVNRGSEEVPADFILEQNYPNPFNPKTGVRFQVSGDSKVTLVVYDVLGREVATLVNERKQAGSYEVSFNGTGLASGVYIYRLTAGDFVATKRMVLVK